MIRCPYCGAEYEQAPEHCAECGMPLDSEPDLFAAALEQERRADAAGKAMQKRFAERYGNLPMLTGTQSDASAAEADEPVRSKTGTVLTVIAVAGIIALSIAAVIGLFREKPSPPVQIAADSGYAFYAADGALYFRNEAAQTSYLLCEDWASAFSLSHPEAMMQLSPDGSRVYYPRSFSEESGVCTLACRTLSNMEQEQTVASISLSGWLSSMNFTYFSDAYDPSDELSLMQPYILLGNSVFYVNTAGQLCRQSADAAQSSAAVLDRNICRLWTAPEADSVFWLRGEEGMMWTSRYTGRCSAMENAPAPCTLLYCSETDEPSEIEFQSPAITSWMIPHTDSSRYFYFTGSYEGEMISLFQLDLQKPRLCEQFDSTELAGPLTMPRFLQAYPDGCCYYIIQTEHGEQAEIRYFKRQHDRVYPVCAADPEQGDEYLDICREAPYFLMRRASAWEQALYHEYTPAEIEMTDFGNAFDPVFRIAPHGRLLSCALAYDSQIRQMYTGALSGDRIVMQSMQSFMPNASIYGQPGTSHFVMGWEQTLYSEDGNTRVTQFVGNSLQSRSDSLWFTAKTENAKYYLYRSEDTTLHPTDVIADNVGDFIVTGGKEAYVISNGKLLRCTAVPDAGEESDRRVQSVTAAEKADTLYCAGNLPKGESAA